MRTVMLLLALMFVVMTGAMLLYAYRAQQPAGQVAEPAGVSLLAAAAGLLLSFLPILFGLLIAGFAFGIGFRIATRR